MDDGFGMGSKDKTMADNQCVLDQILHGLVMEHLAKLEQYQPGPIRKVGGAKEKLLQRYRDDPVYGIFGLDSIEYLGATLAGGTVTSIHRKLGDIYEGCVRAIFQHVFELTSDDLMYSATIRSGDNDELRSADTYLQFDRLSTQASRRISDYCIRELRRLSTAPQVHLIGLGMEVRHCYQTGDSKRTQADEAMARHLLVSGVLPIMPLFCNQSNRGIIRRYRGVWVVKEGVDSYEMMREMSGYDFLGFLRRNKEEFRKPIVALLRSLTT